MTQPGQTPCEPHGNPAVCTEIAHRQRIGRDRKVRIYPPMDEQPSPLTWGGYIIRPTHAKHMELADAPNVPGIYAWYTKGRELMYVGKSIATHTRLRQHRMGTSFWGGRPTYFSFRVVPRHLMSGVENAHLRTLEPIENGWRDSFTVPFQDALESAIESIWRDVLPLQRASLDRKYHALAEQIAARL